MSCPRREPIYLTRGSTLIQYLPTYFSSILKHYESSAPNKSTMLSNLSPNDLYSKWNSDGSRQDKQLGPVIMSIAPSVVSVSVFFGVQRVLDCSGLIIHWDDSNGKVTILTSAKVMRFPGKRDNFYIVVRLRTGEILLAEEHYVDYYNNIMTLKVSSNAKLEPVQLYSPLRDDIEEGTEVVALSRDFYTCSLSQSSGKIHTDYPYFGCELLVSSTCFGDPVCEGGPLITRTGLVCGINFFDGYQCVHPLPTSVISLCLEQWTSHGISVQPWFGLTVIDVAELPPAVLETVLDVVRGESTAVIKQVYEGSPADKVGVRPGDLVIALDSIPIHSASQYYQGLHFISGVSTPDSARNIMLVVLGMDSHNYKLVSVCAENLRVDDRRFCCSWLGDNSEWSMEPLLGSQTDYPYDYGGG